MSNDARRYYAPTGGHPPQTDLTTDRAVFTEAYAVLPRGTMRDIVTSNLPFWDGTRLWVIARPLSGFAETFSQYIVEVAPGGGSDRPELDPGAEGVLFVVEGEFHAHGRGRQARPDRRVVTRSCRQAANGRCATPPPSRPAFIGSARRTNASTASRHRRRL